MAFIDAEDEPCGHTILMLQCEAKHLSEGVDILGKRQVVTRVRVASFVCCALVLTGCGAPDLRAMRPTVHKPTAEVVLVGQPAHWYSSDVQSAATQSGAIVGVSQTTPEKLAGTLQQAVANAEIGLVVVVQNGQIPASEISFANQHVTKRFDLMGSSPASGSAINVEQIVPDEFATGYAAGWLAGELATSISASSVGWLATNSAMTSQAGVRAALAGTYAANPGVGITLVPAISSPTASATANSTTNATAPVPPTGQTTGSTGNVGTVNGTTGAGTGGSTGSPGTVPLPHILMVTRPLTATEWQIVTTAGVHVVSLCPQPTGSSTAQPIVPGMAALQSALTAFTANHWQAGVTSTVTSALLDIDTHQVSKSILDSLDSTTASIEAGSLDAKSVWATVPANLQAAWGGVVVGAGHA